MANYEQFANLYDFMMEDTPYEEWVEYILDLLKKYDCKPEMILDLGCGTGEMTNRLADKGYAMIGVDLAGDMLSVARDKAKISDNEILYLNQDMTAFELYGTVGAVVSTCDSINYILEEEELLACFKLVNNYLDPGGLFIFDINTEYKFKEVLGDKTFAENYDEFSYIWQNYFYEEDSINEYELTMFVRDGEVYNRSFEIHQERAYSMDTIIKLIELAGMEFEGVFEEGTFDSPSEESQRIYFVAREKRQKNKKYLSDSK